MDVKYSSLGFRKRLESQIILGASVAFKEVVVVEAFEDV